MIYFSRRKKKEILDRKDESSFWKEGSEVGLVVFVNSVAETVNFLLNQGFW